MSANDLPDRPDDDVAARLGALQPFGGRAPHGGAAAARRSARRRQQVRTGGLAVAVAAVVTAVPLYLTGEPTAAPPALVPTVEPSATVPSVHAPEPSTQPTQAPEPSSPAPTSAPPSAPVESAEPDAAPDPAQLTIATTTSEPVAAGVLAGFDRPGRDTSGEGAFGGDATWTFDPCTPTAWPADPYRTGWWAWNTYLGDSGTDYAVAVFDTEERAQEALSGFARAAGACWAVPGDADAPVIWQTSAADSEPVSLSGSVRTYSPPTADELYEIREATWVGAVRQGRVVAMVQMHDHFGGGLAALAQGDTRPGTGASFYGGTTPDEAAARVTDNLDTARADAARLAEEASQHLGDL